MGDLKQIAKSAVPVALEKALRYRLLNEPSEAESICLDVLEVDSRNQTALTTLILSLSDRFERDFGDPHEQAKSVLPRLDSEYDRAYYEGIVHERWAKAGLARNMPDEFAAGWLREAMRCYEQAETLSSSNDPDAILRWNTCARLLQLHAGRAPAASHQVRDVEAEFSDDVPMR
ncbi:MAG: hypothetical protein ACR2NU_11950 [Aeoliella sp.]